MDGEPTAKCALRRKVRDEVSNARQIDNEFVSFDLIWRSLIARAAGVASVHFLPSD